MISTADYADPNVSGGLLWAILEVGMATKKVNLIVSEDKKPLGSVKVGQKLQVVAVSLSGGKAGSVKKAIGARLCGGSGTCLALVDVDKGDPAP
jgi:hypothetical protein